MVSLSVLCGVTPHKLMASSARRRSFPMFCEVFGCFATLAAVSIVSTIILGSMNCLECRPRRDRAETGEKGIDHECLTGANGTDRPHSE